MTNTRSLSPATTGEWPTDPNSYQHNKPSVTVLNFNVCLIYQTKKKISNDGCIKQFDSPSLEKIYVQTNLWLEFSRRRSTPSSCNTLLHNGTGQAHTVGSTNITIPGHHPGRQRYTRPGITSINLQSQPRRNFPRSREKEGANVQSTTLQIPHEEGRFLVSAAQLQ